jgi:hypothetical protein
MHVFLCVSGTEELATDLRIVTAAELYLHSSTYCSHPNFTAMEQKAIFSRAVHEEILFPQDIPGPLSPQKVKLEAVKTCTDKRWCSLIHLYAFAGALQRTIQSVYPQTNEAIRPLFNALIEPVPNDLAEGRRGFDNTLVQRCSHGQKSKIFPAKPLCPLTAASICTKY